MNINESNLFKVLIEQFPHEPNKDQESFFASLSRFLVLETEKPMFVLSGYAGTGKTTSIKTLVSVLPKIKYKYVLLAPTGRAAKVISSYSGQKAYTIHKKIYKQENDPVDGILSFVRQENYHKRTVFIVDEASMISNSTAYGQRSLLTDLIQYVFEKSDNKLILIGDEAQLPPVHESTSPALNLELLKTNYSTNVQAYFLKDVVRQKKSSGILYNATMLRNGLRMQDFQPKFDTSSFRDLFKMTGEKFEDGLRYAYDKFGEENSIVICRSNKNANMYNQFIRKTLLFRDEEIEVGDKIMIVRNNYFWLGEDSEIGFIANGDFAEIRKARGIEEIHGMRFCDLELKFIDYPDQPNVEVKVVMDTIYSDGPSMSTENYRALYESVCSDYADIPKKIDRIKAIRNDKYLNALQVKFAYAITCHKSQGGQWNAVFLDQGYQNPETSKDDQTRWLYTACTRASEELYLVNFDKSFF